MDFKVCLSKMELVILIFATVAMQLSHTLPNPSQMALMSPHRSDQQREGKQNCIICVIVRLRFNREYDKGIFKKYLKIIRSKFLLSPVH